MEAQWVWGTNPGGRESFHGIDTSIKKYIFPAYFNPRMNKIEIIQTSNPLRDIQPLSTKGDIVYGLLLRNLVTELTSVPACPFGMNHVEDVSPNHPNKLVRY